MVAQMGTGEQVVSVSESPGPYHSLGRGQSTRFIRFVVQPTVSLTLVLADAVVLQLTLGE